MDGYVTLGDVGTAGNQQESGPVVVMGVSGSGKTAVGRALATRLGVPFADGDDLHPEANVAKMSAGVPLDEHDRYPWLEAVGTWLAGHRDGGVISCSALRRAHRDQLRRHVADLEFVHLDGSPDLIRERQAARRGHFMPPELMTSQLATLEPLQPDEQGTVVDIDQSVDEIVAELIVEWGRDGP